MRLENQVAVITGGARGLGFAVAQKLSAEGAQIAVLDRNGDLAEKAVDSLRRAGARAFAYAVDVADEALVKSVVAAIEKQMGAIHALVNAAAIFPFAPCDTMPLEDWRRVFSVNTEGTLICSRAVLAIMKREGYGRIVNFASGAYYEGTEHLGAYVASKAAVIGLTRVMATEVGPHGITVNAVSPGIFPTEGTRSIPRADQFLEWILTVQHVKRQGQPSDIAELVAYLASPGAGFMTGQTLSCDGGVCYR